MELDGLRDRVALVTGARRGIGLRIAQTLVEQGARVAAIDVEPPEVDGVLGLAADVRDEEAVGGAFNAAEAQLGAVELLVLNAGVFPIEPLEETTLASWRRTIDINLTGAFICAKRALRPMREAGYGRVVAIGSSAGVTGGSKSVAAYAASKAALMTLAKSIASEYAPFGITSNALAPSLIDTDMIADMGDLVARVPVGRLGTPTEVADLVAYLCSSHAGYITGEVIDVNGGYLID